MITVSFHKSSDIDEGLLKFAVIAARYRGRWVFCRHRDRDTWEIPGGHREPGETITETARRELWEETGAVSAEIVPLTVYGVTREEVTTYGMLFSAQIHTLEPLSEEVEIAQIRLFDTLPLTLTYPAIQPMLFDYVRNIALPSGDAVIVQAAADDAPVVAALAKKLWSSHSIEELTGEFRSLLKETDSAVFLYKTGGSVIGFAQCGLRHDYVEGTDSSPVGYLEGIFVEEGYRSHGHAKALLRQCEAWALERGCTEFASDCELTNDASLAFHQRLGFQEANRIICFVKKLQA